jgi:hypothetical protein
VGESYVCKIMDVSSLMYIHEMFTNCRRGSSFEVSGDRGNYRAIRSISVFGTELLLLQPEYWVSKPELG